MLSWLGTFRGRRALPGGSTAAPYFGSGGSELGAYARVVGGPETVSWNAHLPGADLVERGIADLEQGLESLASLLVSIGAQRLIGLGVPVRSPLSSPEHRLYLLLAEREGDGAHSAYNALVRRLVRFERAAECAS